MSPLLVLLLLELCLRALGLGGRPPLFIESPERPGYLQANPRIARRFSRGASPEVRIDPIAFREQKLPEGLRFVVQGASTAAGFPFGPWVGLAGMLGDRLEAAFPTREIEVISTAMAAVNSYALLDLVDEIIAVEPDAVLIYAGHNEYLGLLGVGSALTAHRSRAATQLHLSLKRWGVYELLEIAIAGAKGVMAAGGAPDDVRPASLMARAATGALIPFESDRYREGLEQFETNLAAMLRKYRAAEIPVYIGTLVSNDKDQRPFSGSAAAGTSAPDADGWYALGRRELAAGKQQAAGTAFRNARDRDQLRFRAPTAFNRIVRELADAHGATLVDVEGHLAAASPGGLIGDELLLEHVHPNADGYFLLADAYAEALRSHAGIGDWSTAPSRDEARRDMPVSALDRVLADYNVNELESDFPFRDVRREYSPPPARNDVERLAQRYRRDEITWLEAMETLLQTYRSQQRIAEAAVVARIVARAAPMEPGPSFATGVLLMQLDRPERARRYLERSRELGPDDPQTLGALVQLYFASTHPRRHVDRSNS